MKTFKLENIITEEVGEEIPLDENGQITVLDLVVASGVCKSRGEARRLIQQGGVKILQNNEKTNDRPI